MYVQKVLMICMNKIWSRAENLYIDNLHYLGIMITTNIEFERIFMLLSPENYRPIRLYDSKFKNSQQN